jgi:ABC-2 type transport system permease protein
VLDAYRLAAQLAIRNYRVQFPRGVILLSVVPRVVLQVSFLSYLGYYANGRDGRTFAFVGAAAQIMAIATVAKGADTILDERVQDTLYRVRLGMLPLPAIVAARWLVYTLEGFCMALTAVLLLAVPFGGVHLLLRLLAAAPIFALLALTTSAFGLAVGSFALTQRLDVLITNFAMYSLLLLCGAVAPISAFGTVGEWLVRLVPITNGLLAVRHVVGGGPWLGDVLLEVVVGSAWLGLGVALLVWQDRHARRTGADQLL